MVAQTPGPGGLEWTEAGRRARVPPREGEDMTEHERAIFERVRARDCPQCGAKPGELCRTRDGRELRGMDEQHVRRRILAPLTAAGDRPLGTDCPVNVDRAQYAPVYSARI